MSIAQWLDQTHQGDCLDIMRELASGSVDLVFTSPPYNIRSGTGGGRRSWPGYEGHTDDMPRADYIAWQRVCIQEMLRLIPDDGAIFYNHCGRVQNGIWESPMVDIIQGFPLRQPIVWERSGGVNHNPGYFLPTHEMIYLIAKPKFEPTNRSIGTVWKIRQGGCSWIPEIPAFPVELPQRAIAATNAQVILDPFMGSGTTAMAAKAEGRRYVGIELSARYCNIARQRVAMCVPGQTIPIPPSCYEQIPPEPELPPLGKSALLVYEYIKERLHQADAEEVVLFQQVIADDIGVVRKTVTRNIQRLQEANLIFVDHHGRWSSYRLATPARNVPTSPSDPPNPPGMSLHQRRQKCPHTTITSAKTRPGMSLHRQIQA